MNTAGVTIFFDAEDRDTAHTISRSCERCVPLLHEHLGLATPKDCRIYVMTSWQRFCFQSAPVPYRILLALMLPLMYPRIKRTWEIAGGWAQKYGNRRTVGVKPPRILKAAQGLGDKIFIPEPDLNIKICHTTCHELTHAFTSHLKLPMWLNEGLAMNMVDSFMQKATVKTDSLEYLASTPKRNEPGRRRPPIKDKDALIYQFAWSYWLIRYLKENHLQTLKELLRRRLNPKAIETKVAAAMQMQEKEFRLTINSVLVTYFRENENPPG